MTISPDAIEACRRSIEKISTITSLDELGGYEAEAKLRGITPEELAAIHRRRIALTPPRKRRRK